MVGPSAVPPRPGLRAPLLVAVLLGVVGGGALSGAAEAAAAAAAAGADLPALGELAAARGLLFGAQVRGWSRASRTRTCTSAED